MEVKYKNGGELQSAADHFNRLFRSLELHGFPRPWHISTANEITTSRDRNRQSTMLLRGKSVTNLERFALHSKISTNSRTCVVAESRATIKSASQERVSRGVQTRVFAGSR